MLNAFEIGVSLNVVIGGLEKIQQLAAEFTKVQGLANEVAAQIERMGGVLNTTFASAATSSTEFEGSLQRNLETMRAMSAEATSFRTNMRAVTTAGSIGGGGGRRGGEREGGRGGDEGFLGFGAKMIGGLAAIDVARHTFDEMKQFDSRLSAMRQSGYSQEQINALVQQSNATNVPGVSLREKMFLGQEVGSAIGRENVTPQVVRDLAAVAQSVRDITGQGTVQSNIRGVMRGAESIGDIHNQQTGGLDPNLLGRNILAFQHMIAATGGFVQAETLMHNLRQAQSALVGTDFATNQRAQAQFVVMSEQLGQHAGSTFATLLNTANQGRLLRNPRAFEELRQLGLINMAAVRPAMDSRPGGSNRPQYFTENMLTTRGLPLYQEIYRRIGQQITREQGGRQATEEQIIQRMGARIFGGAGQGAVLARGVATLATPTGLDRTGRVESQFDTMPQTVDELMKKMDSLPRALQDVGAAFDDLVASTTVLGPLTHDLTAGLHRVAEGIRAVTAFAQTDLGQHVVSVATQIGELVAELLLLRGALALIGVTSRAIRGLPGLGATAAASVIPLHEVGVMNVATMRVGAMVGAGAIPGVPGATPSSPVSQRATLGGGATAAEGLAGGAVAGGLLTRGRAFLGAAVGRGLQGFVAGEIGRIISSEVFGPGINSAVQTAITGAEIGSLAGLPGAIAGAIAGLLIPAINKGVSQAQAQLDDYRKAHPNEYVPVTPFDPLITGSAIPPSWFMGANKAPDLTPQAIQSTVSHLDAERGFANPTRLPETTVTASRIRPEPRAIPHVRPAVPSGFRHAPAFVGDVGPLQPIPMPSTPRYSVPGQLPMTVPQSSTRLGPPLPPTGIAAPSVISPAQAQATAQPIIPPSVNQTQPLVSSTANQTQIPAMYVTTLYVGNMQGGAMGATGGAGGRGASGGVAGTPATRFIPHAVGGLHGGGGAHNLGGPVSPFSAPGAFAQKAPAIMQRLMTDLNLTKAQAAGIVGNLGLESGGFTKFHEMGKPENQGGIGWAQWTGPRRREFETWSTAHGLDPRSDTANLGFLEHELTHGESKSLAALRQTSTFGQAAQSFMTNFERPGIPALGQRMNFAEQAFNMPFSQPIELASAPVNTQPVMPPPNTNHYNAQFDIHLDDEIISSHVFNNMFDSNPAGAAGPTAYDKTMAPWAPGTSITR